MSKQVIFNNMVLRDGHQSLAATRMSTEQMLPALEILDSLGFGALETWGGATIDAGLRFLDEFPFDRLDALKAGTPKTPHMMLLRGQNIVQYANFPDDVVEAFVNMSAKHGMDIFRVFDALNDMRNIETAVKAVKAAGKHAQGVMCYTTSPVHTIETFLKMGEEIEAMGCDSICVKDMAGLIPPVFAYKLVKGLKERCKIPVNVHTHETAGLGASTYYAAIEAGADMVDTSITPFANGTGQPDTVRMLSLLADHPRKPEYDIEKLSALR
jgi:oxaloacetate decarboxylase alpha subunit/pyruvate carboxylase subunit B